MKKILFLFTIVVLVAGELCAQEITDKVDLKWGQQVASRRTSLRSIVGKDAGGYYCMMNKKSDKVLVRFNNDLVMTKQVAINLKAPKGQYKFEFIAQHSDELYMFTSYFDKKVDKSSLYIQQIDKKSLLPIGDRELLVEVPQSKRQRPPNFNFKLSEDESRFLLTYDMPYQRGAPEKFGFISFDQNMKKVWQKEVALPYSDELFGVTVFRTDNAGNAYVVGRKYAERGAARQMRREGKQSFEYMVLSYRENGERVDEFKIDNGSNFITDLSLKINDQNELICAGLYSERGSWSTKGSFFLRIDGDSKEVKASSFKAFGFDFITQDLSVGQVKKAKRREEKGKGGPELYQYDLDNLILRADGGAVLVAEQYYVRTYTSTYYDANGRPNMRTHYVYHYNDIIVINISPEGTIEWQTKIPKRQRSTDDGGWRSSYSMAIANDKLYFIFNDNAKNLLEPSTNGVWSCTYGRNAMVALVEMNSAGEFTREALMFRSEDRITTVPKLCRQIGDEEMVVYGSGRKKFRFAKVMFK